MLNNKNIIIDFDSTFIQIEAFDELAKISLMNDPQKDELLIKIAKLTALSMDGQLAISDSLTQRLQLITANKTHITQLIKFLKTKISNSIKNNFNFFKNNAQNIYIVSNGFKEYIIPIVSEFLIPEKQVFANDFVFDTNENIIGLNTKNPLSLNDGKALVVKNLNLIGEILIIGDGFTDYQIKSYNPQAKFFAFVENVSRPNVIVKADFIVPSFDEFLYLNNLPMNISYPKNRIKILLLENIHPVAFKLLKEDGFIVETMSGSLTEDELCEKLHDITILGIRSKTTITQKVLEHAPRLMTIGAFCIGTNQINLQAATNKGICVFNAPYSNTRSVVEMVIGEIIIILRKIIIKNNRLHQGIWDKSANNSFELRGKKLGIIGYGNIGAQLSVLAEALGMHVYFYDTVEKLQLGNAKQCDSLEELLLIADIVSIHVDGKEENTKLIGDKEFSLMKDNVIFINLSRGHIVDIDALLRNLRNDKFLGVGLDVFPDEPKANNEKFISELCGFDNVILTPHIGGSTEEAQLNIAEFVARRIINYINIGDTSQSVNFPQVQLPHLKDAHRFIHLHNNIPGILAKINQTFAKYHINVLWQSLRTNEQVGYIITDINKTFDKELLDELKNIDNTLKCRVLY